MLKNEDVLKVAQLARLELSKEQLSKFTSQLEGILELFSEVEKIDLKDVPETSQITGLSNVVDSDSVRRDEKRYPRNREDLLANAPKSSKGLINVPKIIGEE